MSRKQLLKERIRRKSMRIEHVACQLNLSLVTRTRYNPCNRSGYGDCIFVV